MNRPLLILLLPVLFGCGEPENIIRQRLEFIIEDDLKTIVEEIRQKDSSAVLDRPYYRIVQYQVFEKGLSFDHKAVVEFYYLKTIQMMQVRKYRYSPMTRQWQRYDKSVEYNLS